MSYTQAEIKTAFDEEAGDASSLADVTEVTRWFNDGMARLGWLKPKTAVLTWAADARSVALPTDFASLDRLSFDEGVSAQPWEQFGTLTLEIEDAQGASSAGTAKLYYWAYWPDVTDSVDSALPRVGDAACLYYALSRFYKKLCSSRALYKRYATLLGQNAVTFDDLASQAEVWFNEYLDAKNDLPQSPMASFY